MKIKHSIYDTDTHFSVDVVTRELKNEGTPKNTLIKGDHNSERFTFQFPRFIEGHDMSKCDHVQVHFNNIDVVTKAESRGVYEVDDLQVSPDGEDVVICSWLISGTATKYVGALGFLVRFSCVENDGLVYYVWNTAIYNKTAVSDGIYNGEVVVEDYADILAAWETELKANQIISLEQTTEGKEDGGVNVWTATFGDGRTSELNVRNGSRGPTGLIGSIETIDGRPLHFFVGTQAQYAELTEKLRENLFAIITDDPMADDMIAALNTVNDFINGTQAVPKAQHAVTADAASYATTAGTATTAENAGRAQSANSADKADSATTAEHADLATWAETATTAEKAGSADKAEQDSAGNDLLYRHFHANAAFKGEVNANTVTFLNITANDKIKASYFHIYRESDEGVENFGVMRWVKGKTSTLYAEMQTAIGGFVGIVLTLSADGVLTMTGSLSTGVGSNPRLVIQRICAS